MVFRFFDRMKDGKDMADYPFEYHSEEDTYLSIEKLPKESSK